MPLSWGLEDEIRETLRDGWMGWKPARGARIMARSYPSFYPPTASVSDISTPLIGITDRARHPGGRGAARQGMAGVARSWQGVAWRGGGKAMERQARHGEAWLGKAWQGEERQTNTIVPHRIPPVRWGFFKGVEMKCPCDKKVFPKHEDGAQSC